MAKQIRTFRVSCDHVSAKYQLRDELVTVEMNPGVYGWCWSHRVYGCSKDYPTPEHAIDGMLRDHACTLIRITPAD